MNDSLAMSYIVRSKLLHSIRTNSQFPSRISYAPLINFVIGDSLEIIDTLPKLIVMSDMSISLYNIFYQFRIQTFNTRTRDFKFLTSIALFSFKNIMMRNGNSLSSLKLIMRSLSSFLIIDSRTNFSYPNWSSSARIQYLPWQSKFDNRIRWVVSSSLDMSEQSNTLRADLFLCQLNITDPISVYRLSNDNFSDEVSSFIALCFVPLINQNEKSANSNIFNWETIAAFSKNDLVSSFQNAFETLWPIFFFKIEKINKKIWKNLKKKNNRFQLKWFFIYPHKRQTLMFRFFRNELKHHSFCTIRDQLKSFLLSMRQDLTQIEFFQVKKFAYAYIFKYHQFQIMQSED